MRRPSRLVLETQRHLKWRSLDILEAGTVKLRGSIKSLTLRPGQNHETLSLKPVGGGNAGGDAEVLIDVIIDNPNDHALIIGNRVHDNSTRGYGTPNLAAVTVNSAKMALAEPSPGGSCSKPRIAAAPRLSASSGASP